MPKRFPSSRKRDWVPRQGHYGELSANARWSDKEAKTIREARAAGVTYSDLHEMFGGTERTLTNLCYGRTYKTAGGPIAGKDYLAGKHGKSLF